MDIEDAPETDFELELELDFGDGGLPPVESEDPGPGSGRGGPRPAADPEVPFLTPVIALSLVAFGALGLLTIRSGGANGAEGMGVAWAIGGAFSVLYIGLFWVGAKYIERHR